MDDQIVIFILGQLAVVGGLLLDRWRRRKDVVIDSSRQAAARLMERFMEARRLLWADPPNTGAVQELTTRMDVDIELLDDVELRVVARDLSRVLWYAGDLGPAPTWVAALVSGSARAILGRYLRDEHDPAWRPPDWKATEGLIAGVDVFEAEIEHYAEEHVAFEWKSERDRPAST